VLSAKSLGIKPKIIRPFKIIFIIVATVFVPLSIVTTILSPLGYGESFMSTLGGVANAIVLIVAVLVTLFFVIKIAVWSCKEDIKSSKILRRVFLKNKWIVCIDVFLICQTIGIAIPFNRDLPFGNLGASFLPPPRITFLLFDIHSSV